MDEKLTVGDFIKKSERHFHWKFAAYNQRDASKMILVDAVEIEVKDHETEVEALEAVKKLTVRDNYMLRHVWECTACQAQRDVLTIFRHMFGMDM